LLRCWVMQSNNHSCSWELNAPACLLKCCMCWTILCTSCSLADSPFPSVLFSDTLQIV
jgi:hypothetical protein